MNISSLLGLGDGSRLAVAGCGGKTSLINLIANENSDKKVLISPTTRILPMRGNGVVLCTTRLACLSHQPIRGVQCLGLLDQKTDKLCALREGDLAAIMAGYDIVLLEADGSRGLPCKGWTRRDPVIPAFSTHTVGVVSIRAVGVPADNKHVFRLREFLAMTELNRGDPVTVEALATMAVSSDGMLRRGAGSLAIVINQAETAEDMRNAESLSELIREKCIQAPTLVAGSVRQNFWRKM
jgi:probable selenium-dependent hydroxylase accessory protein YqeC